MENRKPTKLGNIVADRACVRIGGVPGGGGIWRGRGRLYYVKTGHVSLLRIFIISAVFFLCLRYRLVVSKLRFRNMEGKRTGQGLDLFHAELSDL